MRVAIDAAIPNRAFQSDEMPFMGVAWLLAFDDIRHVTCIINIMAVATFKDFLASRHGGVFYRRFRERIARPADGKRQRDGLVIGRWFRVV